LVIVDLPAFDNARERRGRECIHISRGEGIAYILSLHLLTDSLAIANEQLSLFKKDFGAEEAYSRFEHYMSALLKNVSAGGAIGGQLLSTFHTTGTKNVAAINRAEVPKMSRLEICDILNKKTGTFFEIAVLSGWIAGRGDLERLPAVRRLSQLLGMCYQIYDDFLDYRQDTCGTHFSHNYVYHRGLTTAHSEFLEYHGQLQEQIKLLELECPTFDHFLQFTILNVSLARKTLLTQVL
jgi:geranylgeranyl pyrophosphate synthase